MPVLARRLQIESGLVETVFVVVALPPNTEQIAPARPGFAACLTHLVISFNAVLAGAQRMSIEDSTGTDLYNVQLQTGQLDPFVDGDGTSIIARAAVGEPLVFNNASGPQLARVNASFVYLPADAP